MGDKINVVIRVRGLIPREVEIGERVAWHISENAIMPFDEEGKPIKGQTYSFDHIFGPGATTTEMYETTAHQVVQSALEGFNATIFAYGQTSSGKTYSMIGENESQGIIPLSLEEIFDTIKKTTNRQYLLRVSYMEIYNEVIQDLLEPSGSNLRIREDSTRGIFVGDLHEEVISSPKEVYQIMRRGNQRRHVGSTNMNEHSSRSHSIFQMIIESRESGEECFQCCPCIHSEHGGLGW